MAVALQTPWAELLQPAQLFMIWITEGRLWSTVTNKSPLFTQIKGRFIFFRFDVATFAFHVKSRPFPHMMVTARTAARICPSRGSLKLVHDYWTRRLSLSFMHRITSGMDVGRLFTHIYREALHPDWLMPLMDISYHRHPCRQGRPPTPPLRSSWRVCSRKCTNVSPWWRQGRLMPNDAELLGFRLAGPAILKCVVKSGLCIRTAAAWLFCVVTAPVPTSAVISPPRTPTNTISFTRLLLYFNPTSSLGVICPLSAQMSRMLLEPRTPRGASDAKDSTALQFCSPGSHGAQIPLWVGPRWK